MLFVTMHWWLGAILGITAVRAVRGNMSNAGKQIHKRKLHGCNWQTLPLLVHGYLGELLIHESIRCCDICCYWQIEVLVGNPRCNRWNASAGMQSLHARLLNADMA